MDTLKTISNVEFRRNLGQISDEVERSNLDTIVTKSGRPKIAVLSIARYRQLVKLQEDMRQSIELVSWNELPADEREASKQARADYVAGKTIALDRFLADLVDE